MTTPAPSTRIPISIVVAISVHAVFATMRLVLPKSWLASESYYLITSGVAACGALLICMGMSELARRLPERQAVGARIAMVAYAILLGLTLTGGIFDYFAYKDFDQAKTFWMVESYVYLAVYLVLAAGIIVAAGGFDRVAGAAIALIALAVLTAPPPFLAEILRKALGSASMYSFSIVRFGFLAALAYLVREAARGSTRDIVAEPSQPIILMGTAIRTRVIAMFVLIAFTVFAMGGNSIGALKFAMVAAPAINVIAFVVFAVAALRASRGVEQNIQAALVVAAGLAAWCAGAIAVQVPAIYGMLSDTGAYGRDRHENLAQALGLALPLIGIGSVVVALVAVGSYVRRLGHNEVADTVVPRVTAFVLLSLASVGIQQYLAPKGESMGQIIGLGLLAAAAGVIALLVAAGTFKRAGETSEISTLPTATVLPPS